ncbi:type VI secretion system baseplate subunit TssF, partial [Pseudomonas aeruginosa]|uniref:type VI secretion system baseplate subunit TssF n=1 Tax=Pseudomonas aeruginosa TaxID=287 RepID=UPI003D8038D5
VCLATANLPASLTVNSLFPQSPRRTEFFALYASINSYHELRVRSTQGDVYQWKPRMGLQPLL